jgi:hypothetical protein
MKKALVLALAFSAGVCVSAVQVEAKLSANGLSINGLSFNGQTQNGLSGTYLDFTTISHQGLGK